MPERPDQRPAGPVVLGLLLGPLAEENLARTLAILPTRPFLEVVSPIALALLALAVLSVVVPAVRSAMRSRRDRGSLAERLREEAEAEAAEAQTDQTDQTDPAGATAPGADTRRS